MLYHPKSVVIQYCLCIMHLLSSMHFESSQHARGCKTSTIVGVTISTYVTEERHWTIWIFLNCRFRYRDTRGQGQSQGMNKFVNPMLRLNLSFQWFHLRVHVWHVPLIHLHMNQIHLNDLQNSGELLKLMPVLLQH